MLNLKNSSRKLRTRLLPAVATAALWTSVTYLLRLRRLLIQSLHRQRKMHIRWRRMLRSLLIRLLMMQTVRLPQLLRTLTKRLPRFFPKLKIRALKCVLLLIRSESRLKKKLLKLMKMLSSSRKFLKCSPARAFPDLMKLSLSLTVFRSL